MKVAGLAPGELVRRTWRQIADDDVVTYGGALAFHGVLALFPFLLFLLALATYLDLPHLLQGVLDWGGAVVPDQAMVRIVEVMRDARRAGDVGLISLSAVGAVWAASGGVRSATTVLNRAYGVEEGRPAWRRYLLSILYTVGLATLILLAAALLLLGGRIAGWAARPLGLDELALRLWGWTRYALAVALLTTVTAVSYSLLPDVRRFRWFTPGAVVAVLLWIALSVGFQLYLDNFGRYNVLYGSVGAVIVLLLYLWLSSIVLLAGGELNAVLEGARRPADRSGG